MAGLYIHIPFCKRKCIYCDFYSIASSPLLMEVYVASLVKEYDSRVSEMAGEEVNTIYLGGGTPSLMPLGLLTELVGHVFTGSVEEMTIEVNPDDVTNEFADGIAAAGFNRVSVGIQSFDDDELKLLNRRHDAAGARESVALLRKSGFENISIDLIYGIPGQSLQSWRDNVKEAIALGVPHISAYNLTYEEGTRLTAMRDKGRLQEVDDDLCVEMFGVLSSMLEEAGYEQYEISNFALPGMYSKHNSSYWDFTPYLGLGASAHSFDGAARRYNPADLRKYMELVDKYGKAYEEEKETQGQLHNEWVMTRLRTRQGLDMDDFADRFGNECRTRASEVLRRYADSGDIVVENGTARLTKKGIMVSDMIFRDLFIV